MLLARRRIESKSGLLDYKYLEATSKNYKVYDIFYTKTYRRV